LSTLISGGLPITQALEISSETIGNDVYKTIILETRDWVKKGETISSILKKYPDFISPIFVQMLVVGEETGRTEFTLINVANFYQKEIDRGLDTFITLLEPIIIIFLGVLVATLIASVILPLYQIGVM
jgi:type IV pilus assembly protein PilC